MTFPMPGPAFGNPVGAPGADAPLVLLFERDDTLAVPLLSQLRQAGYDVRAARTPVELFDAAQKHTVALIVVDLGNAAASRREFWVALDAQRRGRAIQVLTFRLVTPGFAPETDLDGAPHALADVEVGGPHETAPLVEAVRQRVPLGAGAARAAASAPGAPHLAGFGGASPPGAPSPSPFAHPAAGNPFAAADASSPFDQPDSGNPFAQTQPPAPAHPFSSPPGNPYAAPYDSGPYAQPPGPFTPPSPDYGASFTRQPAMPPMPGVPLSGIPAMPPVMPPLMPPGYAPAPDFAGPGQFAPRTSQPGAPGGMSGTWYAAPWGGPTSQPGQSSWPGAMSGTNLPTPMSVPGPMPVMDAWLPPDGAALPTDPRATAAMPPAQPAPNGHDWAAGQMAARQSDSLNGSFQPDSAYGIGQVSAGPMYASEVDGGASAEAGTAAFSGEWSQAERSTAPVAAWMPTLAPEPARDAYPLADSHDASGGLTLPEERALSTVLVEGALISPQQLAVLKDIRRILNHVDVEYKLGELALLFRFLSPDQLLAALLVSRQLITPEQIAALGRIKQEMAASGLNYDLETLLVMFNMMSREDLDRLRAELA